MTLHAGAGASYPERSVPPPGVIDRTLAAGWSRMHGMVPDVWRLRRLRQVADRVAALDGRSRDLPSLLEEATALRPLLMLHGPRADIVARAFALAREATRRTLGLAHHRVQLMGGAAMLDRTVAEMATGEGKTITALLPAVLWALAGRPVHVVTVNDYLARRDAEQLWPVYDALGLIVGTVVADQCPADRRDAYRADVTYCTNKDLVFDYLRDRVALGTRRSQARATLGRLAGQEAAEPLFLRGLHVAIVDEADSVLIDEARTPLILSERVPGNPSDEVTYRTALDFARTLARDIDYDVDVRHRSASLTEAGRLRLREMAGGLSGVWGVRRPREELAEQALTAICLYHCGCEYVVDGKSVQIVDEFTGRVMPDRTWEQGLHQLIEVKEGCPISSQRRTIAQITFQRFFARYGQLSGMTGTAAEARPELAAMYGLGVTRIPVHRRLLRQHMGTSLRPDAATKWALVASRAASLSATGRAVLIGTRSVAASETVAVLLRANGLCPAVLNAQQSRDEAAVVARGGQAGTVTVATNMAGRGTDIRLSRPVRDAGGLHVILTEHHESSRVDRQLFGRAGRQGDPGSVEVIVAADDNIFHRFAGRGAGIWATSALTVVTRRGGPHWMVRVLVWAVQRRAERMNATTRRDTLREDERLAKALAFAGQGE